MMPDQTGKTGFFALSFQDERLENDFADDYFRKNIKRLRYSVILGFILYAAFGILDVRIIPEARYQAWLIRYAVVCPYLALFLPFTFLPVFKKIMQPATAFTMLVSGLGLVMMISFSGASGAALYYSGLILVVMFTCTAVCLRFIFAASVSMVLLFSYNLATVLKGNIPLPIIMNNNFFFVSANIIGMAAAYSNEQHFRKTFLQTRMINDNLEKLENEIARHRETHEELVGLYSLIKATVESIAEGILVVGNDGKVSLYNETFLKMWRIPQPLIETHDDAGLLEFVMDQLKDPEAFISVVRNLYDDSKVESTDILEFKDGRVFERYSRPQKIGDSAVGRVWCFRDVTERARVEGELIEYRDHLEELVERRTEELTVLNNQLRQSQKIEAVGLLAGGVAHEFNNILTAMKGSAYIMHKKLGEQHSLQKYSGKIIDLISKAATLAKGLLAFSRKQTIELKLHDFNEIVGRVEKFVSKLLGEHIDLVVEPSDEKLVATVDANQMEQVLVNLITNARDAVADHGRITIRTGKIELTEDFIRLHGFGSPGSYISVSVSDSGAGMTEAVREKIFEPFFTTKELGKGTGLGLSIAYGIVKQHNGYIDVESSPGMGTTFTIYIPISETEPPAEELRNLPAVVGGRETILLAEDDADVRNIVGDMLRLEGYSVLEAADGEDALRVFSEHADAVGLVMLDVRMPRKDGKEALSEIAKVKPGVKSLLISGYAGDVISSGELSESGLNFISKSSLPEEILGKVREVLDG